LKKIKNINNITPHSLQDLQTAILKTVIVKQGAYKTTSI